MAETSNNSTACTYATKVHLFSPFPIIWIWWQCTCSVPLVGWLCWLEFVACVCLQEVQRAHSKQMHAQSFFFCISHVAACQRTCAKQKIGWNWVLYGDKGQFAIGQFAIGHARYIWLVFSNNVPEFSLTALHQSISCQSFRRKSFKCNACDHTCSTYNQICMCALPLRMLVCENPKARNNLLGLDSAWLFLNLTWSSTTPSSKIAQASVFLALRLGLALLPEAGRLWIPLVMPVAACFGASYSLPKIQRVHMLSTKKHTMICFTTQTENINTSKEKH